MSCTIAAGFFGFRSGVIAIAPVAPSKRYVAAILGEVIGSHDGKLFRSFAQSLMLDGLLAVANSHLEELARATNSPSRSACPRCPPTTFTSASSSAAAAGARSSSRSCGHGAIR